MFYQSEVNQPIGNWDVSNVTNMANMFNAECGAVQFNQDLSFWDVSSVTDMGGMFAVAAAFNQDISNWNVSSVVTMSSMFGGATSFNQNLSSWDVSQVNSPYCENFCLGANSWTLPKPNFINCSSNLGCN